MNTNLKNEVNQYVLDVVAACKRRMYSRACQSSLVKQAMDSAVALGVAVSNIYAMTSNTDKLIEAKEAYRQLKTVSYVIDLMGKSGLILKSVAAKFPQRTQKISDDLLEIIRIANHNLSVNAKRIQSAATLKANQALAERRAMAEDDGFDDPV